MQLSRTIGRYKGTKSGPLVIALGAVHGNEPAGVAAIREVFRMLDKEPDVNPDFEFRGTFVGLVGNFSAYLTGERYLVEDLNRLWSSENVDCIRKKPHSLRHVEQRELLALLREFSQLIRENQPEKLILLDLHTTSAEGGIFTIPDGSKDSLDIALGLHAPVIKGLLDGIGNTLLHFLREGNFNRIVDGCPQEVVGLAFEGGQHDDPVSVSRCISATINCLRAAGCVNEEDVHSKHNVVLKIFADKLPNLCELEYVHHIDPKEGFTMRPGYLNFQKIKRGEHLADTQSKPIYSKVDGRILMPLYQSRGKDGFFVVQDV